MPRLTVRSAFRLFAGAAAVVAFAASPELALAAAPGSLAQLAAPNSCYGTSASSCPTNTGQGLTGSTEAVVSSDGKNVYVLGASGQEEAIAEFARAGDGSLTQVGCIAAQGATDTTTCTQNATAVGMVSPTAIAISPDGNNVYVAATDTSSNGTVAEFARGADGTLTQLVAHPCLAESSSTSDCASGDHNARGIQHPTGLAVSPDGLDVYAIDSAGEDIATLARAADGSLSQTNPASECIEDATSSSPECIPKATGIASPTGVAISADGSNVYTAGASGNQADTIVEFARSADGSLTQLTSPNDCVEEAGHSLGCGTTAKGLEGLQTGVIVSPDGSNVYAASQIAGGPITEFVRGAGGALTQLPAPNDCIEEAVNLGCGTTGTGIASGFELAISPDGADVYAVAPSGTCSSGGGCSDVAEFARNSDGSLTQLSSPDSCIQEQNVGTTECPGNENGLGLGNQGIAISPDGASLYVTGPNDVAEFARTPVNHTLTVSLSGAGSGAVSDGTGAIACSPTCSHAYTANTRVTLTATPSFGSTFAGWSGACSGVGTCQVTMSADLNVTAAFTAPPAGSPTPVITGAPAAVTDGGAGFSGSVNPDGLATTAYFQYGLDQRYSQVGASGANYTSQTPAVQVGSDFTTHGVGPVTVAGLVPNALYHVRLVAINSAGTTFGQDVTFTTAMAPAPGAPTLGQTFNIQPVSGLVLVYINGHLVPLTQLTQIPAGVPIDTRHGTLELTTASGGGGGAHDAAAKTQTGVFSGAVFRLSQQTEGAGKGLVTVMLSLSAFKGAPSQSVCRSNGGAADAQAASSRTIQLLHASAHGKFRTSGRYSAATVLGTIWTVAARCDGTLIHSIKDPVEVTDFVRHRTIILHAGQSYLAPGPRKHK